MSIRKFIHWAPRICSFAFITFISIFALDVFEGPFNFTQIVGFLVHLLPTFVLIALTIIAWRHELVGAVGFLGFAAWYLWVTTPDIPWPWFMLIAGPALVIGVLYLADWLYS